MSVLYATVISGALMVMDLTLFSDSIQDLYRHYLSWFSAACSLQYDGVGSSGF